MKSSRNGRRKTKRPDPRRAIKDRPRKRATLLRQLADAKRQVLRIIRALAEAGSPVARSRDEILRLLSPREREVALLFAEVPNVKDVAAALGTSPWTVRNQLGHIRAKLGVSSREELFVRLMELRERE